MGNTFGMLQGVTGFPVATDWKEKGAGAGEGYRKKIPEGVHTGRQALSYVFRASFHWVATNRFHGPSVWYRSYCGIGATDVISAGLAKLEETCHSSLVSAC